MSRNNRVRIDFALFGNSQLTRIAIRAKLQCALSLIISGLAFFLAVTTATGHPLQVKDARGKLVTIRDKPVRIVSIAPNTTEILYALGLGNRVVGVTRYCDYPTDAKKKPKVGDMTTSAEAVVALKPDLVLAHALVNDAAIRRLERLGLTVFAINPKTMNQVARDIRTIGLITARPRTAERIASKIERKVEEIKKQCAKRPMRRVLVVIQSSPLWTAGPGTFVDEMIRLVHAKNIAFDARPGFVTFSKEIAISRNPDVIITGVRSDADHLLKSPEWHNTNAVRNNKVFVIKSELMTRPGPRLVKGLEELAKLLLH
ncbi:MAG: cobalamin-binding protein [Armatimonadetes bacterium]|nr:cobalamin-binding protein [Armatimonadota bacterium]